MTFDPSEPEPLSVREARRVIREWEQRNGHDAYAQPLRSGFKGYQARCWDCDWTGPEHLRGDEQMGSDASRVHKVAAKQEAAAHREATKP